MRYGSIQKAILKWIQDNPMRCVDTCVSQIAEEISNNSIYGERALKQSIYRLLKTGDLVKTTKDGHSHFNGNYAINYNKHTLPKEILENAPQHIKDVVEQTNKKLKSGEYKAIDKFGAGIIKAGPAFVEKDGVLYPPNILQDEPEPEPIKLDVQNDEPIQPVEVQPVVNKSTDGKTISISLTINLNL